MKVLDWKYKKTDITVLNMLAFYSHNFNTQQGMANYMGINSRTLERAIHKLKKDNLLSIYRGKDNDIIYCLGDDVKNITNYNDADATYRFREHIEDNDRGGVQEHNAYTTEVFNSMKFDKPEDLCNQIELEKSITKLGY